VRELIIKIGIVSENIVIKRNLKLQIEEIIILSNKAIDDENTDDLKKNYRILKDFYDELLILEKNSDYILLDL
jgi:hypothetical protein